VTWEKNSCGFAIPSFASCIQRHDLQEWDTTPHVHLDLERWLLTLIKT
jgi:hypothetical protein